jgi:hypothetical protein
MRLKKITRARKPRRANRFTLAVLAKRFAHVKNAQGFTWEAGAIAIGAVAICVAVGAMLSAALHTGVSTTSSVAENQSTRPAPAVARIATRSAAREPVAASTPSAKTAPRPAAVEQVAEQEAPVTITGCLEQDDETFRLKNTSGDQAPKARSWKSGFLKKNSAAIEVVDVSNKVQLPSHVGQRVVVTGMLVDREMQVRSLRRVATTCNQTA